MIWFAIFLLSTFCCAAALVIWLGVTVLQGFLTSVERSLTSFSDGHAIFALLYLVPAALFLCAIGEGLYLASTTRCAAIGILIAVLGRS